MSNKQVKKSRKGLMSLFCRTKSSEKNTNSHELTLRQPELQKLTKSRLKQTEVELMNKYLSQESIMTTTDSIINVIKIIELNEKRLKYEGQLVITCEDINRDNSETPILVIFKKWGKLVKTSIENLYETLELFCNENLEPDACFHLNRSIIHLVNLYETLLYISTESPEVLDIVAYNYLKIVTKCIESFRLHFNKFCTEITQFINDFKTTLILFINHRPENRLVISAIGDIEKLYNCSINFIDTMNTSTPDCIDNSFNTISILSNDINDIKYDLINIKHNQDKDMKYINSSYV